LTIVALALLIAIWGVFLGVTLVRKRAEYKADSSIGAFQRQLQVLRRNSQAFDRSAGLGAPQQVGDEAALPGFAPLQLRQLHRPDSLGPGSPDPYGRRAAAFVARGGGIVGEGSRQDPYFRPEACERRRDVLLILVSALLSTGLISIIPAARVALVLTAVAGAALLVYVVLLVRLRAHATERETKLRYMPPPIEAPVFADRRFIAR
jgi:hypothetical protein